MSWWLIADGGCWAIFALVWALAAPFARKTIRRESLASRLKYVIPALLVSFLLSLSRAFRIPAFDGRWIPAEASVGVLSVAMTACGVAFTIWARFTLGKNWSGTVTIKENHELVQHGPYALARHPIYTGGLLAFLGTAIGIGTVRSVLCVPLLLLALRFKMRVEERFMTEQFGEAYELYRKRVKALIPFVW